MSFQLNNFSVNWSCSDPALHLPLSPWDELRFSCGLCTLWSPKSAGVESDAKTTQQVLEGKKCVLYWDTLLGRCLKTMKKVNKLHCCLMLPEKGDKTQP